MIRGKDKDRRKLLIVLILALAVLIAPNMVNAQEAGWTQLVREIVVNHSDSSIHAHITINTPEIATENALMYYWYKQNQIKSNMGGYSGDLLHGEYLVFDKEKNLITKGSFINGVKHGTWKKWNSKGFLISSAEYENGQLHGLYQRYDAFGEVLLSREYKKGKSEPEKDGEGSLSGMKIWKPKEDSQHNDNQSDTTFTAMP